MTIVGATYQTKFNHLMLQSCQPCDVAHDFWYDPRIMKLLWYIHNIKTCLQASKYNIGGPKTHGFNKQLTL